ncbi:phage tail spike protein [Carnobacterium jeotgali]|uniref:phage tail spike protein n=1 Tax=Carnobacterium jeotgali TaxID=545534 RepID=UPI00068F14C0|nr:phage tail spike protein [Carnobacterium jeotgali]
MITLFKPNETNFDHNGLGSLDKNILETVVEEELNGLYSFVFKYPIFAPHGSEIDGQSVIRVPTPDGNQLFRVYNPIKSMGYLTIKTYHIFYDLVDNFIEDMNIVGKNGQGAISQLGGATQYSHTFRFFSNIETTTNARMVRMNPVAALIDDEEDNTFISRWGGELKRNNFDVRMNKSIGTNRGKKIQHRKDLIGYEANVNWSTAITRIMPKGFDGLLLPEKYVDSPLINHYINPKIKVVEYSDVKAAVGEYANDKDAVPLQTAYQLLRERANEEYSVNKVDIPEATYKVDFVSLDQTEEYKDLQELQKVFLGDTVTVEHKEDGLNIEAKVISYKYDPLAKKYLGLELGSFKETFTSKYSDITKLTRKVTELVQITNFIQSTADGKNTINRGTSEPLYPNINDLWYKPNGSETELWQYIDENGVIYWKMISSTAELNAVKNEVNAAIEQADLDRTKAEQDFESAKQEAKQYTEAKAQEFDNQLLIVNQNVLTATNSANAAVLKADKAIEDVGFLKPDVATAKANAATAIQDATTATKNATTAIQNAQTALNSVATFSQEVDISITNINGELTRKVSQTTFNTLSGTVGTHTTQISQTQTALLAKAESSLVNTIKGTVDSHTTQIKVVSDGLELKAESSLVNTVKGTVDSHTSQINANSQAITARLTSVQIETLLTGKQYVNQTTFNATSNGLTAQITQVSTDLSNLEIGGTNLVYNSEIPPFSPINYNGGTYVVSKVLENVPFLNVSTVTEVSRTVGGGDFRPPDITIDDGRNREYTVSVWVRPVSPSVSLTLTLGVNDKEMTGKTVVLTDATKWIRVTYSKKFSANIDGTLLRVYLNLGENQKARFSKIKLEKGIKTTDWSPSPNDMATLEKVVTIEANIDGINTLVASKASQAQVTQLAGQITTKVESATYNSKMTQLDSAINLRVVQGDVTAAILADKRVKDTRNDNQSPSWYYTNYPNQTTEELKLGSVIGVTAYTPLGQLTTNVPGSHSGYGSITQTFRSEGGVFKRSSITGNGTWGTWDKIAETGKLISQINISTEGILLQGKRIQLDGDVTMTAAFVTRLDTLTLTAVYADIATLKTRVLTADVITSAMIKSDLALIDKLFATDANVQRLTAKTAFINSVKAISITADMVTAGTLNAALVNIINLNASKIAVGTMTGANYSLNLSMGVETFRNPSNGSTLSIQQDKFYFNTSGASHYMIPDNEGLAFVPAAGNTGNDRNAGIRLQSANFNFVDLGIGNDGGFKYRIADYSSALTLISKNGGNFIFSHENITENNIGAHKWELLDGNYGKFKYGKTAFTMNGFSIYDVPKMSIYNDTTGKMGTLETQYLQLTSDSGQGLQLSPAGTSFKIAHNANRNWMFDEGLNGAITYGASRITLNGHNTGSAARLSIYNINGNYGFMSAANFDVQSERKYKDDIEDFGGALGIISTMKIHQYTKNGISEIGIITDEAPYQLLADNDTKVSLYDYASLAIRGVQELGDLTWHHEVKLSKHELRIKELEEKIKLLESVA